MSSRTRRREEDNNANGPPKKRTESILDFYDDIFQVITKYLNYWEILNFKRTCKRFNELKIKNPYINAFQHDELHHAAHTCGRIYSVAKYKQMNDTYKKKRDDAMFVLMFVLLLIS